MSLLDVDLAIRVEDPRWEALGLSALADRAVGAGLREVGLSGSFEVSLLATDDAQMAELNQAFRGKDKATNVLSWPAEPLAPPSPGAKPPLPGIEELGDIALGYETCQREALSAGKPHSDHVTHLIVHGLFHLLGYDHETEADASLMEALEIRTLAKLGIDNPY